MKLKWTLFLTLNPWDSPLNPDMAITSFSVTDTLVFFCLCGIRDKTIDACIDGIKLNLISFPLKNKHISHLCHFHSNAASLRTTQQEIL